MSVKKLISIVVPVYNEELNINTCYEKLCETAKGMPNYDFEFIFTDNHSEDNSYNILQGLAASDPRLRAFSFSKNFGYQRSIYTGLIKARGHAAIAFDCDLQDPPELLPKFIELWEAGNKVVYGVRSKRKENPLVELTRKAFYRIINWLSEDELPHDSGDFRLMDRKILDILRTIKDPQPYLRGIIASLGFKQVGVPHSRNERHAGKSKFNFRSMFGLAIDGIISQSIVPLRIASYVGLGIAGFTFLLMCGYLGVHVFYNVAWPQGFTTTTLLLLFSISINALFLGIIGEYLARIYKQVRARPITLIEQSTEMDSAVTTSYSKEEAYCEY